MDRRVVVDIDMELMDGAVKPVYQTVGAAGADVCAYLPKDGEIHIMPGGRRLVSTGIKVAIPRGYEIQVRPRSGLALKKGLTVLNAPGTIDSDYRGEVGVILHNASDEPMWIYHGDRIAQFVVAKVPIGIYNVKDSLSETSRGEGGYGSTGG